MLESLIYNVVIAFESIAQNKTRALLTSLGIVFGVSSVIAMLAIGEGASQEIVEKLKLLGTNNIIIQGIEKKELAKKASQSSENEEGNGETGGGGATQKEKFSPGLAIRDGEAILENLPTAVNFAYETVVDMNVRNKSTMKQAGVVGIDRNYFDINSIAVTAGRAFSDLDHQRGNQVCVIGSGIAKKLFPTENPIGKKVKCGKIWLNVIGIASQKTAGGVTKNLPGIRNVNQDIYLPHSTMQIYFVRRDVVNDSDLKRRRPDENRTKKENFSQIDKLIIEIGETEKMTASAPVIKKLLLRLHNNKEDFEVIVPELLLEQEKSTKQIFNIVLSVIASISLIVGGIGIMNIMFSSVMERTKEIGIRRAIGATQGDIRQQFIIEAVAISLSGGLVGIILGLGMSLSIEKITDIKTIVAPESVLISFFVSIAVGLIFGISPANKAAKQDPITLLRYE